METDFSFNNKAIKEYFEGTGSYVPIRELMYLHTHPLVQPSFLTEINNLVNTAGEKILSKNLSGNSKVIEELQDLSIKIGKNMPDMTQESAVIILGHLRELRNLCNRVLVS